MSLENRSQGGATYSPDTPAYLRPVQLATQTSLSIVDSDAIWENELYPAGDPKHPRSVHPLIVAGSANPLPVRVGSAVDMVCVIVVTVTVRVLVIIPVPFPETEGLAVADIGGVGRVVLFVKGGGKVLLAGAGFW